MARKAKGPSLGSVLKQRRRQLEMTQAQVASKVGCRANYIGYLESGARRPSANIVLRLAKVLDLDAQELFLMANPQVRTVMGSESEAHTSPWERFKANKRLHTRHGVTRAELSALERVAMLGSVRNQRDFLFILQTIRQALSDD